MNSVKFSALLDKLQTATWTLSNALSNTKIFSTKISGQKIKLYNVENGPLYINSQRLDLSIEQIETILDFIDQLIEDSSSEIAAAQTAKTQSLVDALNAILE